MITSRKHILSLEDNQTINLPIKSTVLAAEVSYSEEEPFVELYVLQDDSLPSIERLVRVIPLGGIVEEKIGKFISVLHFPNPILTVKYPEISRTVLLFITLK